MCQRVLNVLALSLPEDFHVTPVDRARKVQAKRSRLLPQAGRRLIEAEK